VASESAQHGRGIHVTGRQGVGSAFPESPPFFRLTLIMYRENNEIIRTESKTYWWGTRWWGTNAGACEEGARRFGCIDCCLWHRGSVGVELNSSSVSAEQTEVPTHAGLGFPTPSLFRLLTPSGDWGFRNSTRGTDARSSFLARTQSPGLKTGGLVHDCRSASESKNGESFSPVRPNRTSAFYGQSRH